MQDNILFELRETARHLSINANFMRTAKGNLARFLGLQKSLKYELTELISSVAAVWISRYWLHIAEAVQNLIILLLIGYPYLINLFASPILFVLCQRCG